MNSFNFGVNKEISAIVLSPQMSIYNMQTENCIPNYYGLFIHWDDIDMYPGTVLADAIF